jgi:hypothetical protein
MKTWAQLRSLLASLWRRKRIESSMADEIRFHVDAYVDDLVRHGVTRAEADVGRESSSGESNESGKNAAKLSGFDG